MSASPEPDFKPMTHEDLAASSESRAKRREAFANMISEAGMDPAQVDVTKLMDDEEQAQVIAHMAQIKRAKDLAKDLGRAALRERLKSSVQEHADVCERTSITMKFDKTKAPPPD